MNRADCIRTLQEEYEKQRTENERDLAARTEEILERSPEIRELRAQNAAGVMDAVRAMLSRQPPEVLRVTADAIKQRGIANTRRIAELLREMGYPEDALSMRFRCPVCEDTGIVGEAPGRYCECFEARLKQMMFEDGSMAGTAIQNFDTFDPERIPEGAQRDQLCKIRRVCETFADEFPDARYKNILLTGQSGLGKTFLLNCIYERVVSRGLSAVRLTAFRMFEAMRQQHMTADARCEAFESLLTVPLLLIDDLGSEPMMRNITVEYMFMLLNERMAAGRATVIASNLTPMQIIERYGERVKSRMFDKSCTAAFLFTGVDLRSI